MTSSPEVRVKSESACLESSPSPKVSDSSHSPTRSGLESDPSPRTRVLISDFNHIFRKDRTFYAQQIGI